MRKTQGLLSAAMLFVAAVLSASVAVEAEEKATTGVDLTVYNQGIGIVRDRRAMELKKGLNEARFTDVATEIDPTSIHFKSMTDPNGTSVVEQNYEYDLVSGAKLLMKFLGSKISVTMKDDKAYSGYLMAGPRQYLSSQYNPLTRRQQPVVNYAYDNVVLSERADGGATTILREAEIRTISLPSLPEGLITKPTLMWLIDAATGGQHMVEVSYMTKGITWDCDYTVVLATDDKALDVNGWVTIDNKSGGTYKQAKLKLIAGDVHMATEQPVMPMEKAEKGGGRGGAPQFEEKSFFEYHMYTLQRQATVKDNQTKQIELLGAAGVPCTKIFLYDGGRMRQPYWRRYEGQARYKIEANKKVDVVVEFKNDEKSGMGMPLPKGKLRVFKRDTDGSLEFIGEDSIDHTPRDEKLTVMLGNAFDVVGDRIQSDFKNPYPKVIEESFKIELRNHKDEDILVQVYEKLYRWSDWEIIAKSDEYEKRDSRTVIFPVQVPKRGAKTVTYTVRYTWR